MVRVANRIVIDVVEHNSQLRRQTATLLKSTGYSVTEYTSGVQLMESIQQAEVDCIIIAMRMPQMSGLDVLRRLGQSNSLPPVLLTTEHTDVPAAMQAIRLGAEDVLVHPISEYMLLDRVQHLITDAQRRRVIHASRQEAFTQFTRLTPRERQIVALMVAGLGTKQIAYRLHLSDKTVENRRSGIYQKLKVDGLAELVAMVVPLLGGQCARRPAGDTTHCGLSSADRLPCRFNVAVKDDPCPLCNRQSSCLAHG